MNNTTAEALFPHIHWMVEQNYLFYKIIEIIVKRMKHIKHYMLSFKIVKLFFEYCQKQMFSSLKAIQSLKWKHAQHYVKHIKNLAILALLYF